MATATIQKEKTGSVCINRISGTGWSSIFPNDQITETQSALFVKKLLAVSISNVAYLRAIFPEHAFGDRCLEDLNLKILRDDSSCPGACRVIQWVKGCFDALDKKYLRMLIIGIYLDPEDPETVIESYTFKFSYAETGGIDIYRNNKKISSAYSAGETRKATIRLLRTIVVLTQTLKSLPDDVMMTMKLMYYDEVTPPDYEPPGFKAAQIDNFVFDEEPMNIKVGDVATQFHTVKMRIKTDAKQFEVKEDAVEEEENKKEITDTGLDDDAMDTESQVNALKKSQEQEPSRFYGRPKQKPASTPHENNVNIPHISPAKPENEDCNKTEEQITEPTETQDEFGVRCPCGCNEDDGLMILCAICKYWQHGVCFQVIDEDLAPVEHVCELCAQPGVIDKEPTDYHLVGLTPIVIQATCLWRRALLASLELNRVLAPHLARRLGIEATVAQGLINRLEKEGYVRNAGKGKRLGKLVEKERIRNEGIPKYFTKKQAAPSSSSNPSSSHPQVALSSHLSTSYQLPPLVNHKKIDNSQVESLVSQTENINISGKREKNNDQNKDIKETRARGKKRAFSKVNEHEFSLPDIPSGIYDAPCVYLDTQKYGNEALISSHAQELTNHFVALVKAYDFEMSASQDLENQEPSNRRRRKSSIVNKAIIV